MEDILMQNINRILVCVDLSDYSLETIESALTIAPGEMTDIILFNVIDSKDVKIVEDASQHFSEKFHPDTYIKRTQDNRQRIIEKMIEEHFPQVKRQMHILFSVGTPYKAILETIPTEKADLVIIASKGRSNLIGTLHGSTAEKVFRHSSAPVLSVRNREKFSRTR
jgi:nucleotide-binding universal stress UspA family protein